MKAEKGDLIRITTTYNGAVNLGDIIEVTEVGVNGIYAFNSEGFRSFVHHQEYVIHRKAGEESTDEESACSNCGKQGVHTCRGAEYYAEQDAVNSPNHYTQGKFETIEVIEHLTSKYDDGFTAHCVGTAFKYMDRAPYKHESPTECLRKAAKYLEFAIAYLDAK